MITKLTDLELVKLNLQIRGYIAEMFKDAPDGDIGKMASQENFLVGRVKDKQYEVEYIIQSLSGTEFKLENLNGLGKRESITHEELVKKFETGELNCIDNKLDEDLIFYKQYINTLASGFLWHITGLPTTEEKLNNHASTLGIWDEEIVEYMDDTEWNYGGEFDADKKFQLQTLVDIMNQCLPFTLHLTYYNDEQKYYIGTDTENNYEDNTYLAIIIHKTLRKIMGFDEGMFTRLYC